LSSTFFSSRKALPPPLFLPCCLTLVLSVFSVSFSPDYLCVNFLAALRSCFPLTLIAFDRLFFFPNCSSLALSLYHSDAPFVVPDPFFLPTSPPSLLFGLSLQSIFKTPFLLNAVFSRMRFIRALSDATSAIFLTREIFFSSLDFLSPSSGVNETCEKRLRRPLPPVVGTSPVDVF